MNPSKAAVQIVEGIAVTYRYADTPVQGG